MTTIEQALESGELKQSFGFIILDESTLTTYQKVTVEGDNQVKRETLIFETDTDANEYASSRLDMWQVVPINFVHKFIEHTPNIKEDRC